MSSDPLSPCLGVFDSGLGGLSVATEIRKQLPRLPMNYLADGRFFPYGEKTEAQVLERSLVLVEKLIEWGSTLIVVACNTATSAAIEVLRETFPVPIVGMEPPLKPALARSKTGRVLALVTPGTEEGEKLDRLLQALGRPERVRVVPMPGLADLIEQGHIGGTAVEQLLNDALHASSFHEDQIVLGCTHYGFLKSTLRKLIATDVEIQDAADPVARRVKHLLGDSLPFFDRQKNTQPKPISIRTTGSQSDCMQIIQKLRAQSVRLPPLDWHSY